MSEIEKLLQEVPLVPTHTQKRVRKQKPSTDIKLSIKYEECLLFALNTALYAYKNKNQPRKKYWREMIEVVGK